MSDPQPPSTPAKPSPQVWFVVAGALAAVAAATLLLLNRERAPAKEEGALEVERLGRESMDLMRKGEFKEARSRLQGLLDRNPGMPAIHLQMGRCLMALQYYEAALGHLQVAMGAIPEAREECRLHLGVVLKNVGRVAQAVVFFEPKFQDEDHESKRGLLLAECYLDLERYGEALALLEHARLGEGTAWARFRALCYQQKATEALEFVSSLDATAAKEPSVRATQAALRASHAREQGDFAAAHKLLEDALLRAEAGSREAFSLRRASMAILLEAGEAGKLEAASVELEKASIPRIRIEAIWNRAMARLLAGKREAALETAREFLAAADPEYTPLRWERMMMRHLVGELKDADLESEVKALPRSRANDLLYYLALATGGRAWAEKALEATPGRNYPYHAIRRLLGQ